MAEAPEEQLTALRGLDRGESHSYLPRVSDASFPMAMRGYDRAAVDEYIAEVSRIVAELETRQSSESVIKRALHEVGEQTSSILQKAHDTAEEITRKSRAQSDDRLQAAEREAAALRREADELMRRTEEGTQALLAERREIVEEVRKLADELLGVADDAVERMQDTEAPEAAEGSQEDPEAEDTVEEQPS